MATRLVAEPCLADAPPVAIDVARGVSRLMFRADCMALCEVPLGNGRRADIMAIDAKGCLTIVEIKVSRADLLGDMKWPDYLDYCDRFFWAIPPGFDASPLDGDFFMPDRTGVIVADRYAGEILREARSTSLSPARRKAETLRFARRAAGRLMGAIDPDIIVPECG